MLTRISFHSLFVSARVVICDFFFFKSEVWNPSKNLTKVKDYLAGKYTLVCIHMHETHMKLKF